MIPENVHFRVDGFSWNNLAQAMLFADLVMNSGNIYGKTLAVASF